ncbi:LysR family transcriptional regulator [Streptomyces sp. ZYX-F-203]
MELEVRHLRALCAIAEAGSLHRAARLLGVSQPTLSHQLGRIERALGGALFIRERTGCRPTPLGRTVVGRARPLLADLRDLVHEARAASHGGEVAPRLGATASDALAGWLRRLRERGEDPTLRMDVSGGALLGGVAEGRLDVAFVHEVEGFPLRVPEGLCVRVLVDREPRFVMVPVGHPTAARKTVRLVDLAADRWMVDPTVDGEWEGLQRVLRSAGIAPRVLYGDPHTAASLVAAGEAVTVCRPGPPPRPDVAVRRLHGDPIGVRLLVATRTPAELDAVFPSLREAYWEAVRHSLAHRDPRDGGPGGASHPPGSAYDH